MELVDIRRWHHAARWRRIHGGDDRYEDGGGGDGGDDGGYGADNAADDGSGVGDVDAVLFKYLFVVTNKKSENQTFTAYVIVRETLARHCYTQKYVPLLQTQDFSLRRFAIAE